MKKILIIEDDTALRENTAEMLELLNYKTITAANGNSGIKLALQEQPDLIICDIMMPEIDGYGVLKALSLDTKTSKIPFIFLSAKTSYKEIRKGMDLGADDYLTKPFEEEELKNAVASRIAKAHIINKNESETHEEHTPDRNVHSLDDLKKFFDLQGEEMHFKKRELLYEEGSRSYRIFVVLKGVVKTYRAHKSGKELITSLHKSGDFLGFTSILENVPYQETAEAIEDVVIVGLVKSRLQEVLENSHHLSIELMQLFSNDLAHIKEQLLQMAYSSVRKKTAQTIIEFAHILCDDSHKNICIARNDLASVAGIATETLIRTLSEFKHDGLIAIEGRNIKILDLKGLKLME